MQATNWPTDWRTWKPPSRQFGGPVQSLAEIGQPMMRKQYQVGEAGPEMYVPDAGGQPMMVGMNGPEVRGFPQPGHIIPNHELPGRGGTFNLADLGDGTYGMPGRMMGGRVRGYPMPESRQLGGQG